MIFVLEEKLEPATKKQFDLLEDQILKDKETQEMLMPPMKDIPQYRWIFRSELQLDIIKNINLFEGIKALNSISKIKVLFSKAGSKFTGFLAYQEKGSEITSIKMASFKKADAKSLNPVLIKDLVNFLNQEISRKTKITWIVYEDNNSAINQYDRHLDTGKFIWFKDKYNEDGINKYLYTITGKK